MLKRTMLLLTVICAGLVLFTSDAISSERSNDQVITSGELQKMSDLRNKMIQSNLIEGNNALRKVPSILEVSP